MATFQNRELEIDKICNSTDQNPPLLTVFGEAGIGKTSLLKEAAKRLRATLPPTIVLMVDLESIEKVPPEKRLELVLLKLGEETQRWIKGDKFVEIDTSDTLNQIVKLADRHKLFLMFDTTETFQQDMNFWGWVEEELVRPIVIERGGRAVFAGRIPPPWRRIEVRRNLERLRLRPLPPEDAASSLVREVFKDHKLPVEDEESIQHMVDLVLDFSFGHPQLSEKVAQYVAKHPPTLLNDAFRRALCKEVVIPFIENELFDGIDPTWREILWWLSVLDQFDPTIMQMYLGHAAPDLVNGQPDYYFIQGLSRLRLRDTVVWRESDGDSLHGVIRPIVRHCLKVADPERYAQACRAAAVTFTDLAQQFPEESLDAQNYFQKSQEYEELLTQEGV